VTALFTGFSRLFRAPQHRFCARLCGDNLAVIAPRARMKREERTMIRGGQLAFAIAGFALVVGPGWADGTHPENEDSRFSFYRVADGFLRLDGSTGEVSLCARRPAGWLCQALPEERAALEAEIDRVQRDNAALKKELLAHDLPLPAQLRSNPAPDSKPWLQGTGEQAVDHVVSAIGQAWRRLVDMIEGVQRDLLKKS
jgi:hypothetical protein